MKTPKLIRLAASSLVLLGLLAAPGHGFGQTASNPPAVTIYSPTNNAMFLAPANLLLYARAVARTGTVQAVEFFAGDRSLGVATNALGAQVTNGIPEPAFLLGWSNVLAGKYALKAVVTDSQGITATSAVVNISVVTNFPPPPVVRPSVYIYSPTNGSMYLAPASFTIYARAVEGTTGVVQTVQFFAGDKSLGVVSNRSQVAVTNFGSGLFFPLTWSNVLAGSYPLKAIATDAVGMTATSQVVTVSVVTNFPPPPVVRPTVYIYSPTNGAAYLAPANLTLYARAFEGNTGVVQTVQFLAGTNRLGVVSNSSQVVVSNISSVPLFPLAWSNVIAGSYELRAIATDAVGMSATSSVVKITVTNNVLPPTVPYAVGFWYPTNGQSFSAPANIGMRAWVVDSNIVKTVQFFAGATSLGTVSNTAGVLLTNSTAANPFYLLWSNVLVGSYTLTAVASDAAGLMATSTPVNIKVLSPPPPTNRPPEVRITSPPNAAVFRTPINLPIYAYARDPDGFVESVELFAGTNSLGMGSPVSYGTNSPSSNSYTNVFFLVWSNAPQGEFGLTAKAADNSNACAVSLPVKINILPPLPPPTNRAPVISIVAIDPVAIEGTNCWVYSSQTNIAGTWSNWPAGAVCLITNCGPKNATFSAYRSGDTNTALTVTYAIGGTATNGVDYAPLSGRVTIPAGQRQGLISVVPLDDGPPDVNTSVILKLIPSTLSPPLYVIGSPASAAAMIIDSTLPRPTSSALPDRLFHLSTTGPNGAWFHVESSSDMFHWTPICTNQVVNGSIDFVDPDAAAAGSRFYRTVPETNPPQ